MINKTKKKKVNVNVKVVSIIGCALIAILFSLKIFNYADQRFSDYFYYSEDGINEKIFVIGIDDYTLSKQGTWPLDRKIIAETINKLNSNPDTAPAVIGVDITFDGYTNPESDQALVDAASFGNVVTACYGQFDGNFVKQDSDKVFINHMLANEITLPFDELKDVVKVGHTNAMYDSDGILRRHLFSFDVIDGRHVESFPYQVYSLYMKNHGLPSDFKPKQVKDNFWRFNFDGKPGEYFSFSLQDILNDDYDPDLFDDAIVLIGPYDAGFTDDFLTSSDIAVNMYGVEYLANVTSSMLKNVSYYEISEGFQYILVFAICLLLAKLTLNKGIFRAICIYIVAGITFFAISYELFLKGYVLHPLWLSSGLVIMFTVSLIAKYFATQKDKAKITDVFGRYVDPKILKELLNEDIDSLGLKGKSTKIAVLFVDIRGFTTISEELKPEEVVKILDAYLSLTSECIKRNDGTVDKFIGDCTMGFWGAPLACQNSVYKACQAALEMVAKGEELNLKLKEKFGKDVNFGVGINYGEAVVGNIGSSERMDYTAIGDTVNTASRLESNAPRGTIYVSQSIIDELGDRCVANKLENKLKLKGKAEPVTVYELISLK